MRLLVQSALQLILWVPAFCLHEIAKGCGTGGKHCIGRPHDCLIDPKTCDQLAAVSVVSTTTVHVEIRSKGPHQRNRWVALGFSEDENMGRDAVVHCIQNGSATDFLLTYNPDHLNVQHGIVQKFLHPTESAMEDDGLHCAGDLEKKILIHEHEFDLTSSHHFLFSTGPVKGGRILKHDKVPIISTEGYQF